MNIIKLLNYLFGWDFIMFKFGSSSIMRRVIISPNNKRLVKAYGSIYELLPDGKMIENGTMTNELYTPLTFELS